MQEGSSLSERVWNIDWSSILPWTFESGVICERVPIDRVLPFAKDHYERIFASATNDFFQEGQSDAKLRFYRETDVFLYRDGSTDIGFAISHPTDWSAYYLRMMAVLPEHQDRHVGTEWTVAVMSVLKKHGVGRFEIETAPANHRVIHGLNKLGFMVTSTTQSERWGVMLRYTKFLDELAEECFVHRYCMGGRDDARRSINQKEQKERRAS
jgi:RimJ/RimL family protein N-acetyltransferase